ncbi:arylesterase [Allomuricauda taeanensis]|uniref:arylesterase n=1 Tax=Flagellimonas taeanensis TaxID=1005926 RepID=UPI002E7C1113|nr:arylesterase [Allomuricauda taeanensis]MEE1962995.1 arylesterase [Allomuricauda taeanensis]
MPLIFCYFLCLLLIGCGGKTKEKEQDAEAVETKDTTVESSGKKILFFGDSLTAGYGLDVTDAFPSIIQEKVDSLGLDYQVVNAGLSGETTASGRNRMAWVLEDDISVVVLELGANDGLRGIPLEETRKNLQAMVDMIQEKLPQATIVLAGMQIPPNMGPEYTSGFRDIFPELAQKEDLTLIPFLLEGVAGIPELNQGDGIHPTQKGQQLVAENVWEILAEVL